MNAVQLIFRCLKCVSSKAPDISCFAALLTSLCSLYSLCSLCSLICSLCQFYCVPILSGDINPSIIGDSPELVGVICCVLQHCNV